MKPRQNEQARRFDCPVCTVPFPTPAGLGKHFRTMHADGFLASSQFDEVGLVRCPKCYMPYVQLTGHIEICEGVDLGGRRGNVDPTPSTPVFTEYGFSPEQKWAEGNHENVELEADLPDDGTLQRYLCRRKLGRAGSLYVNLFHQLCHGLDGS